MRPHLFHIDILNVRMPSKLPLGKEENIMKWDICRIGVIDSLERSTPELNNNVPIIFCNIFPREDNYNFIPSWHIVPPRIRMRAICKSDLHIQ